MSSYKAIIKNISQNEWLVDWYDGVIALNKFKKYATEFFDEAEAESTLELLNDTQQDCLHAYFNK